jgi:hypothetical protein
MADTTARAKQAGRDAVRAADSPWIKALGQWGVAAIGIVHLLLAWIAVQVAFGGSDQSADNSGALKELAEKPFGTALLAVMALGLLAYTVWQAVEAAIGFDHVEPKKKPRKRISAVAKAVIGAVLALQCAQLVLSGGTKNSSQSQQDWTAKLMGAPAGQVLVVVVGLALIAFSGYLAYKGWKKKFVEKVEGGLSEPLIRLGQVGWIARGVAFGVLGALVVVAGFSHDAQKANGLDGALKTLAAQPFGTVLLCAVALGLAAYGVFQLATCRRRREG